LQRRRNTSGPVLRRAVLVLLKVDICLSET
jgi:hypothetical protein